MFWKNLRKWLRPKTATSVRSRTLLNVELLESRVTPIVGAFASAGIVLPREGFDGVVALSNSEATGSGATLYDGRHILTAAHVVDGASTATTIGFELTRQDPLTGNLLPVNIRVSVPVNSDTEFYQFIHPNYDPEDLTIGNDIAVLTLVDPEGGAFLDYRHLVAPFGADRYHLWVPPPGSGANPELSNPGIAAGMFTVVGYGKGGQGADGNYSDAVFRLSLTNIPAPDPTTGEAGRFAFWYTPPLPPGTPPGLPIYTGAISTVGLTAQSLASALVTQAAIAPDDLAVAQVSGGPVGTLTFDIRFTGNLSEQIVSLRSEKLSGGEAFGVQTALRWNGSPTSGIKRWGQNTYDSVAGPGDNVLRFDFDNGNAATNAIAGSALGVPNEVGIIHGDSGGPGFFSENGRYEIVGISSSAFSTAVDVNRYVSNLGEPRIDGSFGEIGAQTRITQFASWIGGPPEGPIMNGPYDLVLDMNTQVLGNDYDSQFDPIVENLVITAERVGDNIQVRVDGSTDGYYNGVYYSAPAWQFSSLTIRGSSDHETIRVLGPLWIRAELVGGPRGITIDGREGNDTIQIGATGGGDLSDLAGPVTVVGGDGINSLMINDAASSGFNTYTMTGSRVERDSKPPVDYSLISSLTLRTGSGDDIVNALSTSSFVFQPTVIQTGGGNDRITIGDGTLGLFDIRTNFLIDAGDGLDDRVIIQNSAEDADTTFVVSNVAVVQDSGQSFYYEGVETLTLNAGSGNDEVKVHSTNATTTTVVNAGAGNDQMFVGSETDSLGTILGALRLYGDTGGDRLTLKDQGTLAGKEYTLASMTVDRADAATIRYFDFTAGLSLYTSGGNDLINVRAVVFSAATIYGGPGNDRFHVGGTDNTLRLIGPDLSLDGGFGDDEAHFWDIGETAARNYVVNANSVAFGDELVSYTINHASFAYVALRGAQGGNTVNVHSTAAGTMTSVNSGIGNDDIYVASGPPNPNRLDQILGDMYIDGQGGNNSLDINDSATAGPVAYTIGNNSITRPGIGTIAVNRGSFRSIGFRSPNLPPGGGAGAALNAGWFFAGGLFDAQGNFTQTAADKLNIEIAGPFAVMGYDQIEAGSAIQLAGTLDLELLNGYMPSVGAAFTIINNTSASTPVSGTFEGLSQGGLVTENGITFQISYQGGDGNDVVVTVREVNAPPSGTAAIINMEEDTAYTFSAMDFGFSDEDNNPANNLLAVKVTTLPNAGTLTNGNVPVNAGGFVAVTDINAGYLVFSPAANGNGTTYTNFTFQVQDDGGTAYGGVDLDPAPKTMTIDVMAVNDAPVNTEPGSQMTNEDTTLVFSSANGNPISISDIDAASAAVQVSLSVMMYGTLTLSGTTGLIFSSGDGTADTYMTFSGTIADINAALNGLTFTPDANYNGSTSINISTDDLGNTGGGALSDYDSVSITISPVNDAPLGTASTVTISEDTAYTFWSYNFGFTDPNDSPANNLLAVKIATLPSAGTLTRNGLPVTAGSVISVTDIDAGWLLFTPAPNANGTNYASFTFQVQDNGGTANGSIDLDPTPNTMTINVTAINDAPVNTVPGSQTTNEDSNLVFSSANGNAISISDADAGSALMQVSLSVMMYGTLSLSGTTGLSFSSGDGSADTYMTFTGTLADINAALNGLTFTPNANYNGSTSINISTGDLGNTGGSALSDYDTVNITVSAVNDAPGLSSIADRNLNEGIMDSLQAGASDVDLGDMLTFSLVSAPQQVSIDPQTGSISIMYMDGPATYTVTVKVTDSGGLYDVKSFQLTVNNIAPTANLSWMTSPVNQASFFDFYNENDQGFEDQTAGFLYSYDFNNDGDFDDPGEVEDSSDGFTYYTFTESGYRTIRARIKDKDGGFTDIFQEIFIPEN